MFNLRVLLRPFLTRTPAISMRHISDTNRGPTEPESLEMLKSRLGLSEETLVGIRGTGSPYDTKVKRRREVSDISIPKFDGVECLKWPSWMVLRDIKRRHNYEKYWQCRLNLQNLRRNRSLPNLVREIATEERLLTPRSSGYNYITNRCAITGRTRGKFIRYRLSRIVWRDLADHGLLSGIIRAKWG